MSQFMNTLDNISNIAATGWIQTLCYYWITCPTEQDVKTLLGC